MKQLNMMVEDEVKQAAVDGARSAGMLLNKWVSKAILTMAASEHRTKIEARPAPGPFWEKENA